ncbi:MAG: hypothetical protein RL193_1133 [Actinomycetota bacterium]|jgi:thiol reductant ABC exporter CydC subunit
MIPAYLLSAFSYVAGVGLNITSGWLITMASFMPPVLTLSVAVVMVRFFGISRAVTRYFERIISHKLVFGKLAKLRSDLYRKIISNPSELIISGSGGRLIKQVVDDVERAQEYELRVVLPGAASLITLFAATGLAFWLQPGLGLMWLALTTLLGLGLPRLALIQMTPRARELERLEGQYAEQVRASVHGSLEAEIYGYLSEVTEHSTKLEIQIKQVEKGLLKVIRGYQVLINLILTSALLITFLYANSSSLPPVQVAMLVFLALTGFEATLAWYPNLFTSGKLQLAKENLKAIPSAKHTPGKVALFDSLVAKNYSAYWDAPFMKAQNFELKAGSALVLRGASGIGKSTTAMGVLGLIRYSGSLTINGIEVSQLQNLPELAVGALQNGHIFNTSLRENLKISGNENFDDVIQLLELEQLISELPEGLDTIIGEFGRGISGGEAKRIVLARALLSDAPLLVLDEPTEHLDPELAARITERILDKYRDRALLIITHSGWSGVPQLNL